MRRIGLLVEDFGHEVVLTTLLIRLAKIYQVAIECHALSVRGGHGKVVSELKQYLREVERDKRPYHDLLIVATDANCKGFSERKRELSKVAGKKSFLSIIYAIPDPHLERWLLLDSTAFKRILGKGCQAPDKKCEKDRYKRLFIEAVREAGVIPLLGGLEYAKDIVEVMDLAYIARTDVAIEQLLQELYRQFQLWQ
jgi:hypothetical protein